MEMEKGDKGDQVQSRLEKESTSFGESRMRT